MRITGRLTKSERKELNNALEELKAMRREALVTYYRIADLIGELKGKLIWGEWPRNG
jgi:hypothetical protein